MKIARSLVVAAAAALIAPPAVAIAADPPQVRSTRAVLIDGTDGHVLYEQDADARGQIASVTKLMTASVALEELPLDKEIVAGNYKPSSPSESIVNLRPGERMEVADLLRALLLESANDAAATLARAASGSQQAFVEQMNREARKLGLRNTHFQNPIGLDSSDNYSTPRDLARLTRVLQRNEFFVETVKMPTARLLTGAFPRTIENRNGLIGKYPFVTGAKTGHTKKAGYALVGSGTRNGVELVSVVLGGPSRKARDADTVALLEYGFSQYRTATPVRAGATIDTASIEYFGDDKAKLTAARTVVLAVRKGERVRTVVDAPQRLEGPIEKGKRVGTIQVLVADKGEQRLALVTADEVPGASIFRKAANYLLRPWLLITIAVIVAALAIRGRRRRSAAAVARQRRRRVAKLE